MQVDRSERTGKGIELEAEVLVSDLLQIGSLGSTRDTGRGVTCPLETRGLGGPGPSKSTVWRGKEGGETASATATSDRIRKGLRQVQLMPSIDSYYSC